MISFIGFCRDLFLLAHAASQDEAGLQRGRRWENRVIEYLTWRGVRAESLPGGCSLLGHASLSGLPHQLDATLDCMDAIVIGEWKAYRGAIPKNELLRFKAVSDDYFLGLQGRHTRTPIMRVFGGSGQASEELRRYAAIHGITLLDSDHWPAPLLASGRLRWDSSRTGPEAQDCRLLAWLSRPLQQVLQPQVTGAHLIPAPPTATQLQALLHHHDRWSEVFWEQVDATPGRFERLVGRVASLGLVA